MRMSSRWPVTGAVSYALNFLESDIDTSSRKWKGSMKEMFQDMGYSDEKIEEIYNIAAGK